MKKFKKRTQNSFKNGAGFTFLETVFTITVITLLFVAGMPVYLSLMFRNDLVISQNTTASVARRAQLLSQAVDADGGWGIKIQSGGITLFQGTSYVSRDTSKDETHELPSTISPSGSQEIVYTKFIGLPSATGTIIFTAFNNATSSVTINEKGTISF